MPPRPRDDLAGCTVLVTAHRRADELAAALERRGCATVHAPVMSIVPHVDDLQLVAATREVITQQPDTVVVTTGVGLRGWVEAADAAGLAGELIEVLAKARIIARGPKAHGAIRATGLTPDWVAESETSAEVLELLLTEGVAGHRIAVQHHGSGSDGLDLALEQAGADVIPLVVYRWGPAPSGSEVARGVDLVAAGRVDAVVFTSAPGVVAFLDAARDRGCLDAVLAQLRRPGGVIAGTVGPVTAAPLVELGVDALVPDRYRLGALVRALDHELTQRRGRDVATIAGALQVGTSNARLDGRPLPLTPAALAVLRLLVDADGAVVTREDILSVLPGNSGDGHAAEMAVARLRDALGNREVVATVVKRGYRLRLAE